MANDRNKIFEESKQLIQKNMLLFISDIIALLPISHDSFYRYFPIESDEYYMLKSMLDKNRVSMKSNMRKKWYDSENATLQVALMKLIANEDEAARLSGFQKETKTNDVHTIKWNTLDAN